MPKVTLAMPPPCTRHGHPLSPCHPKAIAGSTDRRWREIVHSLQNVLTEILIGEAYRHGLSPHLRRDIGLLEEQIGK